MLQNSLTSTNNSNKRRIKSICLNFGPQHPAAHGIVRLVLELNGEIIKKIDAQFGLLHRGTEKLIETKNYLQSIPYFDRFDYVANIFQEHAFCLSIEKLINNSDFDLFLSYLRTIFDELSRILNHLLTLAATCLDIGSMGSLFWAFEEREKIMELFEKCSGARMHTAIYKPNNFDWSVITIYFFTDLTKFILKSSKIINSAFLGLLNNRILKSRLSFVGSIQQLKINNYGITGLIARSSGCLSDVRLEKQISYGSYWYLNFKTFIGVRGDNLDRFLLRIKEILESFKIINQCLYFFFSNDKKNLFFFKKKNKNKIQFFKKVIFFFTSVNSHPFFNYEIYEYTGTNISNYVYSNFNSVTTFKNKFNSMESVINHFKLNSEYIVVKPGLTYQVVESPKGNFGTFLLSDGSNMPYRCKVRTPVAHNMNLIPSVCSGLMFADLVATFCSLDIVLGEIDR